MHWESANTPLVEFVPIVIYPPQFVRRDGRQGWDIRDESSGLIAAGKRPTGY